MILETEVFDVLVGDVRIRSPRMNTYKKKIIRERILRENPKLAEEPEKLKKEIIKRIADTTFIDSSYYLG